MKILYSSFTALCVISLVSCRSLTRQTDDRTQIDRSPKVEIENPKPEVIQFKLNQINDANTKKDSYTISAKSKDSSYLILNICKTSNNQQCTLNPDQVLFTPANIELHPLDIFESSPFSISVRPCYLHGKTRDFDLDKCGDWKNYQYDLQN